MENLGGERKNTNKDDEVVVDEEAAALVGRPQQPFHHHHHHRHRIPSNVVKIPVFFTIVTLSCLLLYRSTSAGKLFPNLYKTSYFKHGNFSATPSPSTNSTAPNKTLSSSSSSSSTVSHSTPRHLLPLINNSISILVPAG